MKWFDDTIKRLENNHTYTRKDLIALLREDYPYAKYNSYNWAVADMLKSGQLTKTGYNQYRIPDGSTKTPYIPYSSKAAEQLQSLLPTYFPDITFSISETQLLNEFIDAKENTIFIETDRSAEVFKFLQMQRIPNLIYKPSEKSFLSLIREPQITCSPASP